MAIKMLMDVKGSNDENGTSTKLYKAGEELETAQDWQKNLAQRFIEAGMAVETSSITIDEVKSDDSDNEKKKSFRRKAK
jgi:hypothetical protein